MKSYVGTEVQLHSFLSKVLDGLSDQPQVLADLPPRKDPATSIGYDAQFTAVYICKKVNSTLQDLVQQKEEKYAFWALNETNIKVCMEDGLLWWAAQKFCVSVCIKLFQYTEVLQCWKQRSTTITLTKWRHKDEPRDFSLRVSSSQFTRLTSPKISLNVKKVEANGLTWPFNVTFFPDVSKSPPAADSSTLHPPVLLSIGCRIPQCHSSFRSLLCASRWIILIFCLSSSTGWFTSYSWLCAPLRRS